MRIRYTCHYGHSTGYARAARDYLAALARLPGVELEIVALGAPTHSPDDRYRDLDARRVTFEHPTRPDVEVVHAPPQVVAALGTQIVTAAGQVAPRTSTHPLVAMTTWETNRMPAAFVDGLRAYRGVILPSRFSRDAVIDSDATITCTAVPHTLDTAFWASAPPPDGDVFRFLSVGAWGERKNMLGVLRAYLHAFTAADRVHLTMLIAGLELDEVRGLIARSGLPMEQIPAMTIPAQAVDELELRRLHRDSHCFVSATRGEGWGLGMFEAAATGRMVIAPRLGGQIDFLNPLGFAGAAYPLARLVHVQRTPCFGSETRLREVRGQVTARIAIPPGVTCAQAWFDPDLMEIADAMRTASTRWADRYGLMVNSIGDAAEAQDWIATRFGYDVVGPKLLETLHWMAS